LRILHMTPELPFEPGGGGGRGREYFLCRRLVELGHEVLNVSPVMPDEVEHADCLRDAGAENWVAVRPASPVEETLRAVAADPRVLAAAVTSPVRALEMRVFWTRLRDLIHRAVEEWRPDVAVVGHDMATGWARGLPPALPALVTLHNLTWQWYLSRARRASGLHALLLRAEAARYRHYLLRQLPRFAAAACVSTNEASELASVYSGRIETIPTGVDTQLLAPAPEQDGPPRVLFTGTLSYPPNSQGIRWFAEEVWPAVTRDLPDARLEVVGRGPTAEVLALGERPGITVVGPVPLMDPYFAHAHVVVVPILTGAGIRVKIVEAMANGRAIVSTSLGWEGLPDVLPGEHLLAADDPRQFAADVVRLLRDEPARSKLAQRARELAVRDYDWRGLGDRQEALLREIA
jgi:glycosyltransferase involved in cell wall biosynthesis